MLKCLTIEGLENKYVTSGPQNLFYDLVDASGSDGLFAGCNKTAKPSFTAFSSPDEAGNGLLNAAKAGDQNALLAIFGPDSKDIISLRRCRTGQSHGRRICDRL